MPYRLCLPALCCAALFAGVAAAPGAAAQPQPAAPAPAPAPDTAAAATAVQALADRVVGLLRDTSLSPTERTTAFRTLLRQNVAIQAIGDRLIRRQRAGLTPEQYRAYQAAFPDFIVAAYGDRLRGYADARVRVLRASARGTRGDVDVAVRVITPGSDRPLDSVWTVRRQDARYVITNLSVAGVNLALTQEADFAAYIERNGFDALVAFMRGEARKS